MDYLFFKSDISCSYYMTLFFIRNNFLKHQSLDKVIVIIALLLYLTSLVLKKQTCTDHSQNITVDIVLIMKLDIASHLKFIKFILIAHIGRISGKAAFCRAVFGACTPEILHLLFPML